jgi:very-short-patch-repair endonuclease
MLNARARWLRRNLTDAERRLWSKLRRRQVDGHYFRRQAPIGPYVVDFICLERRLIVELDGGQHASDPADAVRTKWLEGEGYRLVRFWNNEALSNPESVVERIRSALRN